MTETETKRQRLAESRAEERAAWVDAQERLARAIYHAVGTVRGDTQRNWSQAGGVVRARYMLAAGFCLRMDGWREPARVH